MKRDVLFAASAIIAVIGLMVFALSIETGMFTPQIKQSIGNERMFTEVEYKGNTVWFREDYINLVCDSLIKARRKEAHEAAIRIKQIHKLVNQ